MKGIGPTEQIGHMERYGKEVRMVMQDYGISNGTPWDSLPESRKRPHMEAAEAAIMAYLRDMEAVSNGTDDPS